MSLLDRLRRPGPTRRVAVVGDADAPPEDARRAVDEDAVDAVVEMRPSRAHATSRFGKLEQAATAVALWVLRVLAIVLGLVLVFFVLRELWSIVLPVVLALILSTVLWPVVKQLRRVMPAALAAALALVVFLGVIIGIFAYLIPRVLSQASGLVDQVVTGFESLQQSVNDATQNGMFGFGADQISTWLDDGLQRLQSNAQSIASSVGSGLLTGLFTVGSALITLLLVLVLTFFFTKDGPRFLPWLHLWSGQRVAGHVDELLTRVWTTLGGYIYSQAAVALVDAVFIGLGLWIIGVPFAFPLAVLVFFAAFIPIVGAVTTGALATLVALVSNGWVDALLTLGVVLLVQQLEGNVLQPLLVGKTLALHPAVVILAVTAGGTLAGIIGAFLAVPIAAVGTVVFRYVRESVLDEHPTTGGGKAPLRPEQVEAVEQRVDDGQSAREAAQAVPPPS
ncbi:AI-2E family transporter [uncultured Pseudokineococcus sp.]|uniref:AI-2E family transporter n=1 Tax=uncultured Pseudokineococcus sp. TaxID=1642928 RepID=UPI00262D436A|nr:AI-2E family transporter [uncultured Pseudokineococcus sp.]